MQSACFLRSTKQRDRRGQRRRLPGMRRLSLRMRLRYLRPEEKAVSRRLYETCFPEDTPKFVDYYYAEKCRDNEIIVLEQGEKICSMIHANPFPVSCCKSCDGALSGGGGYGSCIPQAGMHAETAATDVAGCTGQTGAIFLSDAGGSCLLRTFRIPLLEWPAGMGDFSFAGGKNCRLTVPGHSPVCQR